MIGVKMPSSHWAKIFSKDIAAAIHMVANIELE